MSFKAIPEEKPLEVIFMAPELQSKGELSEKVGNNNDKKTININDFLMRASLYTSFYTCFMETTRLIYWFISDWYAVLICVILLLILFYRVTNTELMHPHSLISTFVSLPRYYNTSSFYIQNFKPLPSFYGCAGQFVSYLVANPKDRFSH